MYIRFYGKNKTLSRREGCTGKDWGFLDIYPALSL
jgi:hypothetical protein